VVDKGDVDALPRTKPCYLALMSARKSAAVILLAALVAASFVPSNGALIAQTAPATASSLPDTDVVPTTKTLAYHLATNAVGHARGMEGNSDDMWEVSGWRYSIYSGTNLAYLTNAKWSTNFWLAGVKGLSATCIGYSNGMGGQGLVTMVSPRHFLFATHMHPEGGLVAFLDPNNVLFWRKAVQRVDVTNDTSVGILDADLPPSVGYLPVLPPDYLKYFSLKDASYVQGIGMNQGLRVFSQPMQLFDRSFVIWNIWRRPPFGLGTNWNVAIRGGDSSNPDMLLIGNQLVLASHTYTTGSGPNYAFQINDINRQMHYLSTANHVKKDYQLTQFSLTNWPVINR
jgi:hypothetical protein